VLDKFFKEKILEISKDKVVEINYTLKDNDSNILDSSEGQAPLVYIHGNGNLIPGLESALEGKETGNKIQAKIKPEDAYGVRDDSLVETVSLKQFENADDVKEGIQFQIQTNDGVRLATVTKVDGDDVSIDMNHPLADVELNFDVEIMSIRDASAEELEHGHVHGEGGHHH
jgi:FKBP-type peptidyl-prolyl cis-trans isomerase SlyD